MNHITTAQLTEAQREVAQQRSLQQGPKQDDPTQEDRVLQEHSREVQRKAAMLATVGLNRSEIEAQLIKDGVKPGLASKFAIKSTAIPSFVQRGKSVDSNGSGRSKMIKGALLVVGGIVASVVSYNSAAPGGTYTLWVGAVLGGAVLITRGLFSD